MGQDKPTQLGPLERASLNHWTRQIQSPKCCGLLSFTYQTMDRVQNKPSSSVLLFFSALSLFRKNEARLVVRLSPLGTAATTGPLYQYQMIDDDCGAIGGMRIGRGSRSTRRKPAPMPLCPPQIPHDLTRAGTRATAVGSRRLTAWAMARPCCLSIYPFVCIYPS
jgi:hypothetical protein